jgi:hypothetical protein
VLPFHLASTRDRALHTRHRNLYTERVTVTQCIDDAGIPKQQAVERTALLSDEDVIQLAEHADQLRAAGGLNRWQIAAIVVGEIDIDPSLVRCELVEAE